MASGPLQNGQGSLWRTISTAASFRQQWASRTRNFILPPGGQARHLHGEAFATAARFAQVLARHGVKPGDRVAVQVEKSPEALILYLACLRLGAIYLPLNTDYTANELALFRCRCAEPSVFCLFSTPKDREKIAGFFPDERILTLTGDGTWAR